MPVYMYTISFIILMMMYLLFFSCCPPEVVTFPQNVDQVCKIASLCNDNEIPLIPFGSGTGLEGGINAVKVCFHSFSNPKYNRTPYYIETE